MKKIILISCASEKLDKKAKAKDLYNSDLFKKSLSYAGSLKPDSIFILSAKYGLLSLDEEISPYNLTLNNMKKVERETWAKKVILQLSKYSNLSNDEFTFLAGKKYREFILPQLKNYKIPMEPLGIGKQKKWLKEQLAKVK